MSIGNAVQRGNYVYVYDEKGQQLCTIPAGQGLTGYTSSSVNIKNGNYIYTYNEKGQQITTTPAR
jgi:hypothetical protein